MESNCSPVEGVVVVPVNAKNIFLNSFLENKHPIYCTFPGNKIQQSICKLFISTQKYIKRSVFKEKFGNLLQFLLKYAIII